MPLSRVRRLSASATGTRYRTTMVRSFADRLLTGSAELTSSFFSNRWMLTTANDDVIARLDRLGKLHVSTVTLKDGSRWVAEPAGTSTVRLVDAPDHELATITRTSWWGRRWEIAGASFGCELVSDARPRRWRFEIGGSTIAELTGSLVSYNRIAVDAPLALPLPAVMLAWHVVARPWEAAAAPGGLIPSPRTAPAGGAPEL